MRVAFVDLEPPASDRAEGEYPFGRGPERLASPSLLSRAARAQDLGDEVSYHPLSRADVSDPAVVERLRAADRVVICSPGGDAGPLSRTAAMLKTALVAGGAGQGGCAVELFDPFPSSQGAGSERVPAYHLARGEALAHAEADVAPPVDPVHPWACPSATPVSAEKADMRIAAAAQALCGSPEAQLYLCDERIRTDMPRLRTLAELVRAALRDHRTLLKLHVRAWPDDLLGERVLDHLSLLPLGSLDLLAGSLHGPSLARMGSPLSAADVTRAASEVLKSGLSHLARLSLVLGLPGESAEQCVTTIHEAFRVALTSRIPRLRFSFWAGASFLPSDPAETERRFLSEHPEWHPIEYRGIQDLVALLSMAHPQLRVVGPAP